jgi:hypothetical protein
VAAAAALSSIDQPALIPRDGAAAAAAARSSVDKPALVLKDEPSGERGAATMENFAGFEFSLRHSSIYVPLARAPIFDMPTYSDMAGNKEASFGNGSSGAFDDDSPLAAKLEAQGPGPPAAGRPDPRGPGPPNSCKKAGSHYHRRLKRPTPSACIEYYPNR